jgi:hypothetical protein
MGLKVPMRNLRDHGKRLAKKSDIWEYEGSLGYM